MTTTVTTVAKRVTALLFAFVFCVTLLVPAFAVDGETTTVSAETQEKVDALKQKQKELDNVIAEAEKKRAALNSEIAEAKASASEIQEVVDALQAEVNAYQSKIDVLNSQISVIQKQLDETEANMANQEIQITATQQLLAQRLRAMYMAGNISTIELIFEADSFENLLNRIELVSQITKHDNEIVEQLKEDIAELKKMQAKLEEDKIDLQASKDELVAAQSKIVDAKKEVDAKLKVLQVYLSKLKSEDAELIAIEAEASKQQNAYAQTIYNMLNGVSTGDGSASLICPVPYSSAYISSRYGYRSTPGGSGTSFHYGIDITMGGADAYDKKIIAAGSGTVLVASNGCGHNYRKASSCGCNGGYGNYCVIDHG
ncbi:MAG: hypothetical protein Q4F70_04315, partial [Clostridia bacterium]|nr:hypothetical protein [Clostridia bacterium]